MNKMLHDIEGATKSHRCIF